MSAAAERIAALREACANLPHGVRARYSVGCRCMLCRAANSRYECKRAAERLAGEHGGIVPADQARAHLVRLSHQGVGYKSVADAAGVGRTIMCEIRTGKRRRIRATTERAILGVDAQAVADHALIPAAPTWRRINQLLERGYTKAQLAKWLGCGHALQLRKRTITAVSAARVERMCALIEAGKLRRDR